MCIGIPAKVVSLSGNVAKVEYQGLTTAAIIDLVPQVTVGDYVLLHAGFAIQILSVNLAQELVALHLRLRNNE